MPEVVGSGEAEGGPARGRALRLPGGAGVILLGGRIVPVTLGIQNECAAITVRRLSHLVCSRVGHGRIRLTPAKVNCDQKVSAIG